MAKTDFLEPVPFLLEGMSLDCRLHLQTLNQKVGSTMQFLGRAVILALVTVSSMVTLGCGGNANNALSPQFQPQVANTADNFQFQTTGITNITQTINYSWQNSGTRATVNQACAITGGNATLTIRDPQGIVVYSGDLKANGTFSSIAGNTGTWAIRVDLSNTTGTLNFRVQKL